MVIPGTQLHGQWQRGEYQPYEDEQLKQVLKDVSALTPEWVRVDRLVRDISKQWVAAGTEKTNMRQEVEAELKTEGRTCRCIRCREVKGAVHQPARLKRKTYETQGGREIFLSFEAGDALFSLLRLRLPERASPYFAELKGAAIIREVHTFGATLALAGKDRKLSQHRGLGRQLIAKAEKIARKAGYKRLAVISAVGTREYYRKFGFEVEGLYMTKRL
jgi:elongator complex protein 3